MVKRKASQIAAVQPDTDTTTLRRSTRRKPSEPATQASDSGVAKPESDAPKAAKAVKAKGAVKKEDIKVSPPKPKAKPKTSKDTQLPSTTAGEASDSSERSYWLMKAEPESRFENGTDVKFSIDDLASRTEPEHRSLGIRNYAARNNLRAMKKGDIAFFYHSNCKEPGIVGTMEVVQEHSPDVSAHDPKAPYYDASSKPDEPKWSVVHVKFHSKFKQQIGLKELREMGKPGQPLESMQMIKQSRLSVSRVSATEFEYLMGIIRERGGEIS